MVYDLHTMLEVQKQLNQEIKQTQHLTNAETRDRAHLCIMVELMELCNETRCFNYWSKKQRSSDEVILEEFADVLCFTLTAIFDFHLEPLNLDDHIQKENNLEVTARFLQLTKLYAQLDDAHPTTYFVFLKALFELGFSLGYNLDQINQAYLRKVQKNYKVQDDFKK